MKLFFDKVKEKKYLNTKNQDNFINLNLISSINLGSFFHPTLETFSNQFLSKNKEGIPLIVKAKKLNEEEYALEITKKKITIYASTPKGVYYGLLTLKDLKDEYGEVKEQYIQDEPELKIRGFQIDISRNKVPKKETIFKVIDLLSQLRYNHLELYVEGFSFEYKSQPFVYHDKNYITVEEFLDIQHYANQHFIDLVPSENGFGHMSEWLKVDQYKHLAISDDLFEIWGSKRTSSTLDPTNERSLSLVRQLYKDMIPYANSKYFNMNFDEPYELGFNKTKEVCDKLGKETVFVNYFNALAETVKQYGKTPLLWGDFLIHNPKAIKQLDKEAILIDWGYTYDYPFLEHAKMLSSQKRKFMLAPGTSSWSTAASKYLEMQYSVDHAVSAALKYDALGVLLTDWGDFGHLQYFMFSIPGIIYASSKMWHEKCVSMYELKEEVQNYFKDDFIGQIVLELSMYQLQEKTYKGYSTKLFNPIIQAELVQTEKDPIAEFKKRCLNQKMNYYEIVGTEAFLKYLDEKLSFVKIKNEYTEKLSNTLILLKALVNVQKYIQSKDFNLLNEINQELEKYLENHKSIWLKDNKKDGYELSASRIKRLENSLILLFDNKKEAQHE